MGPGSWLPWRRQRKPMALVLGTLAGLLAAMAVLPSIVPLTGRVARAEDQASLRHAFAGSRAVVTLLQDGVPPRRGLARQLGVDGVRIVDRRGETWYSDGTLPEVTVSELCPPGEAPTRLLVGAAGERWSVSCEDSGNDLIVTANAASAGAGSTIALLVVGLAAMVGISTAFGVLQILSPLSRITEGLERVQLGERGVRVKATGLAELDDLIGRLNGAARAMEAREDAITGRVQLVQEMARLVAHEIRNPLQSLELLSSLVAAEDDAAERAQIVQSIQQEVRALEKVVSRMLRSSDGQALRIVRQQIDPHEILERIATFRGEEARRAGVRLELVPSEVRSALPLDTTLVSRSIENLVANALAFVPPKDGVVRLSSRRLEDRLVLEVEDNGPGVPLELGEDIYNRNVSSRPGGHGLGLALVQAVARAHGGFVTHGRSSLGGASFRFMVPLGAEASPLPPEPHEPALELDDLTEPVEPLYDASKLSPEA